MVTILKKVLDFLVRLLSYVLSTEAKTDGMNDLSIVPETQLELLKNCPDSQFPTELSNVVLKHCMGNNGSKSIPELKTILNMRLRSVAVTKLAAEEHTASCMERLWLSMDEAVRKSERVLDNSPIGLLEKEVVSESTILPFSEAITRYQKEDIAGFFSKDDGYARCKSLVDRMSKSPNAEYRTIADELKNALISIDTEHSLWQNAKAVEVVKGQPYHKMATALKKEAIYLEITNIMSEDDINNL